MLVPNIILFDNLFRENLYPVSSTRAVADIRCGIFTMKERWEIIVQKPVYVFTVDYLQKLYASLPHGEVIYVDSSIFPDTNVLEQIFSLQQNEALIDELGIVAGKILNNKNIVQISALPSLFEKHISVDITKRLMFPWQIFQWNDAVLRTDFTFITHHKKSLDIDSSNSVKGKENLFIEEGATVNFSIINAETGPVYIGKNATIMEGVVIRGPVAVCEGSVIKAGAVIYGATTIGPMCTAGGEIKNSVMQSFSNKAHEGYLGDSYIGSWCNLGAGTSNSNVKNTGTEVLVWNSLQQQYIQAGLKCGVIMGDYTKTAINSSINTGTIIGVCCNVFGDGLLPKRIPDFNWGTKEICLYAIDKALKHIALWKKMKHQEMASSEREMLQFIFNKNLELSNGIIFF